MKQITEKQLSLMKAKESLSLSHEYLTIAKSLQAEPKFIRGAIDTGYNAAELCAKGLLWLKLKRIPKTHKGIVQMFGELYVKSGKIERDVGRSLSKCLEYRNLARYEEKFRPTKEQVDEVLELINILQKVLKNQVEKI